MRWEELIQHAARSKELRLRSGTVRLHVFKGDMPDIHLYDLELQPLKLDLSINLS